MGKKKGLIISVIVILFACLSVFICLPQGNLKVEADEIRVEDCEISALYDIGDSFTVPDGQVYFNGETKPAESRYVLFPSGKANSSAVVTLDEAGEYGVYYSATFSGTVVTACKTFIVNRQHLVVNDANSYAYADKEGLKIGVAAGDEFVYDNIIDLSAGDAETPLIRLSFEPVTEGTPDAKTLKLRFTDIYDEDNYITISLKNLSSEGAWADPQTYITVSARDGDENGLENGSSHINDLFGTPVHFSMVGRPDDPENDSQLVLYYDYAEKQLFADREIYSGGMRRIVADLDDETHFPSSVWDGFTTGEVRLSVFAEGYQAIAANITVYEINGSSKFELQSDNEAPSVSLDDGIDLQNLPYGLKGKPFTLFAASAFDKIDGEVPVTAKVYYRYNTGSPVICDSADGYFVPAQTGEYVIEYSAKDVMGNVGTKLVTINVYDDRELKISAAGEVYSGKTGEETKLFEDITYSDNSGTVSYTVTVTEKASGEETDIDLSTKSFRPLSEGEYEVRITAKDYVSETEYSFGFTAIPATDPQIYDEVSLNKYFIAGASYEMPGLYAYDFSSGKAERVDTEVFVSENGGAEKAVENGIYVPEAAGSLTVTYRYSADGRTAEKSYNAVIVDTGYGGSLNLASYFVATDGTVESSVQTTGVTYSAQADATIEFINKVQVRDFSLVFNVGENNGFDKIHIYLTDAATGKKLQFTYARSGDNSLFSLNGGSGFSVSSGFTAKSENFSFAFDGVGKTVSASADFSMNVTKWLDGSDFDGFTDSLAYLTVSVGDVTGAADLQISSVNKQTLNSATSDRFVPQILCDEKSGDRTIGERVTLTGAFVYDVLDPNVSVRMTVTDPDGQTVTTADGVLLDGTQDYGADYTIELTKYGDYTISYFYSDGAGRSRRYTYAISAIDDVPPEIVLGNRDVTGKAGKEIKIATATATDNLGEECTLAVYVEDSEGVYAKAENGGRFVPAKSGVYTVRYMAFDQSGNYSFVSYKITVS